MIRALAAGSLFIAMSLAAALVPHGALAAEHPVRDPASFAAAVAAAQPGDTIVLAKGTWRDAELVFTGQGTQDQPITLCAESPGDVILSGRSRLAIAGEHLVVRGLWFRQGEAIDDVIRFRRDSKQLAAHCRLEGCAIDGYGSVRGESKWVSIYGHDNVVEHCRFADKTDGGTLLVVWLGEDGGRHRIASCAFGPRPRLGKNGGETIRIGDSATSLQSAKCVVEANVFTACDGEAEIISNKSCDNLYRGNTFLGCAGALTLRHGNRCRVEANFFFGQGKAGAGGVRIIGEDHVVVNNYFADLEGDDGRAALSLMNGDPKAKPNGHHPVRRAIVAFNTVVACKQPLLIGLTDKDEHLPAPPTDCQIANNLLHTKRGPVITLRDPAAEIRWQGNLCDGEKLGIEPTGGVKLLKLPFQVGDDRLMRLTSIDPPLPAAAGDWPEIPLDMEGQPRSWPSVVGADVPSNAKVKWRPQTAQEVVAEWMRR